MVHKPDLMKKGIDISSFKNAAAKASKRTPMKEENILVTGHSNGKFDFIPLIDQY